MKLKPSLNELKLRRKKRWMQRDVEAETRHSADEDEEKDRDTEKVGSVRIPA